MTSQTWRLKRMFFNESFAFNTRHKHFYNFKLLHTSYLSEILYLGVPQFTVPSVQKTSQPPHIEIKEVFQDLLDLSFAQCWP